MTDRQVERLYMAWKSADPQGKERIVDAPLLAIAASEEVMGPIVAGEPVDLLLADLDAFIGVGRRARRRMEGDGLTVPMAKKARMNAAREEVRAVCATTLSSLEALCST